jgi:hypothetical protein
LTDQAGRRPRHKRVVALIVVASIVGFLAIFALWAKRQLLESNTWADTSSRIIQNKDVQVQVSDFLTAAVFDNATVHQNIQAALPPRAAPAAGAIEGALRQLFNSLALRAVQTPKFQELWKQANERAHATLIDVVEKGGSEDVNLDLGTIADQLGAQAGISDAASKLPANVTQIKILDNSDLVAAQKAIHLLETLAWVLTLLMVVLFGVAIYLADGWRRIALRDVGIAFIVVGIFVLALRSIAGTALVNHLASTEAVKPAVSATWGIGTSLLKDIAGATVFYGIVILLGAWIAGPGAIGRSVRHEIAPVLASRGTAYGSLAVLLVLLFAWSPTPGFQRLATSILIILLLVVGLEFLRRQTLEDFPGENMDTARERWTKRGRSLTSRGSGGAA